VLLLHFLYAMFAIAILWTCLESALMHLLLFVPWVGVAVIAFILWMCLASVFVNFFISVRRVGDMVMVIAMPLL